MAKPTKSIPTKSIPTKSLGKVRSIRTKFGRFAIRLIVSLVGLLGIGIICLMAYIFSTVNAVEPMVDSMGDKIKEFNSKPSRILSADGKVLYENRPLYRENITLSQLPDHLIHAVIAAEDKRYYQHPGVDATAMARVLVTAIKDRSASQGGSTITMQLAKRLFSASERTMNRKVQDIAIAIQMEKKYSKDSILEMYFNQVYFGEQAYGIAAAAETYFNKKVKDLTIGESAMLARCVRSPSQENPVRDFQASMTNRNVVLRLMLEENWITQSEHDAAVKEVPKVRKEKALHGGHILSAPHFVGAVLRELKSMGIDISSGGYTVRTTLDSGLQANAEVSVRRTIRGFGGYGVNAAAFICCDSEGRILADVGGIDYTRNQFSYTRQSLLQPGSSFKPFVYAEALKQGFLSEYSSISNEKLVIKGGGSGGRAYIPRNSRGSYGGDVSLYTALTQSINVPAIRTLKTLGYRRGAELISEDFGFKSKLDAVPSLALGSSVVKPLEMARAYSVFMLNGRRIEPFDIRQVVDGQGEEVYSHTIDVNSTRLGAAVCNTMDRLLRGVVTSGSGKRAMSVPEARGKTGTTNEGKSIWFCGYAKGVVGIAWAGNEFFDKKRKRWLLRSMPESYGGDIAAPLWASVMNPAIAKFGNDVKPVYGESNEEESARLDQEAAERRERRAQQRERAQNDIPAPIVDIAAPDDNTRERTEPDPNRADPARDGGQTNPDKPPVEPPVDLGGDTTKKENPGKEIPPKENSTDKGPPKIRAKRPEESEVSVSVCADSGQLSNAYCPSTITRTYARTKRPRGRCNLHRPPDEGGSTGGARR